MRLTILSIWCLLFLGALAFPDDAEVVLTIQSCPSGGDDTIYWYGPCSNSILCKGSLECAHKMCEVQNMYPANGLFIKLIKNSRTNFMQDETSIDLFMESCKSFMINNTEYYGFCRGGRDCGGFVGCRDLICHLFTEYPQDAGIIIEQNKYVSNSTLCL